jgi:hypothetical protein
MGCVSSRFQAVVVAACAGQVAVAAMLAGLTAPFVAAACALGAALGATVARSALRRAPAAAAMLALGGLGMTLGWWADLALAGTPVSLDTLWCRSSGAGAAGHLASWMNAGMLALGLPAARLAQRDHGHGGGAALTCALTMLAGMSAGTWLAARLAPGLGPSAAVAVDYAAMLLGMVAGMAVAEGVLALRRTPLRPARASG